MAVAPATAAAAAERVRPLGPLVAGTAPAAGVDGKPKDGVAGGGVTVGGVTVGGEAEVVVAGGGDVRGRASGDGVLSLGGVGETGGRASGDGGGARGREPHRESRRGSGLDVKLGLDASEIGRELFTIHA